MWCLYRLPLRTLCGLVTFHQCGVGGIQSVQHRTPGRGRPTNISVRVDLEDDTNKYIKAVYAFEIKSRKDFGFAVGQEKCQLDSSDGQSFFFQRSNGSFKCSDSSLIPNVESSSLLLPILGGDKRLAPLYDFCRSVYYPSALQLIDLSEHSI